MNRLWVYGICYEHETKRSQKQSAISTPAVLAASGYEEYVGQVLLYFNGLRPVIDVNDSVMLLIDHQAVFSRP